MADPDTDDNALKRERGLFHKTHVFIDSHIRLVKNSIYVVAGVGIILIARSIHMTKIFTRVEHIPQEFILKHFKLLGKVTSIGDHGMIQVQHIPILRLPFISNHKKVASLPIYLAYINVSPHGRKWLVDNVHNKEVWFTLLYFDTTVSPTRLYTAIKIPKIPRDINVNEELIKQGLCRVTSLDSNYSAFLEDKFLQKYLDRLIQLESQASHKKIGLWGGTEVVVKKKRKLFKTTAKIIKSIIVCPYNILKWLFMRLKK